MSEGLLEKFELRVGEARRAGISNAAPVGAVRPPLAQRAFPLTCTLIAFNEADRIGRAIQSVAGIADEVLVVDSGSTDGTVEICRSLGARVVFNPWQGFGPQKRFAEDHAANDWILNIDADEWLTESLRVELSAILAQPLDAGRCFRIRTRIVYPNREAAAPFAHFHNYVRLYNRKTTRFSASLSHDEVPATTGVEQCRGDILHRSYRDVGHVVTKTIAYYELQNSEKKKPGGIAFLRMLFEFPFQFFKYYIIRRHIFGGSDGFVYSVSLAMGRWMRIFILGGW